MGRISRSKATKNRESHFSSPHFSRQFLCLQYPPQTSEPARRLNENVKINLIIFAANNVVLSGEWTGVCTRSPGTCDTIIITFINGESVVKINEVVPQAAQTLLVIYIRDSIALRFEPFKRMYENRSNITQNSTCSKGLKKRSLP